MAQPAIQDSFLEELQQLPADVQRQLRELVHELAGRHASGLRFAVGHPMVPLVERTARSQALPSGASPEDVLTAIRALLGDGQTTTAREVAVETAARFPSHPEIQAAARVLDSDGKAIPKPGKSLKTDEELEWLRSPPEWARGKWVALVGRQAVASSESLAKLAESLKTMDLPKKPLVHRID